MNRSAALRKRFPASNAIPEFAKSCEHGDCIYHAWCRPGFMVQLTRTTPTQRIRPVLICLRETQISGPSYIGLGMQVW